MIKLGSISVTPVVDSVVRLLPTDAYETTSAVDWSSHASLLDEQGFLRLTLGGYLVRSHGRVILVDAGVGPDDRIGKKATMPGGKMLKNLRVSGTSAEEVTDVVFTHLHLDHVGWGAVGDQLMFPNATYRCHAADWDYFTNGGAMGAPEKLAVMAPVMECWSGNVTLAPGFDVVEAPGHTPGSSIVVLSDGDERGVLLGDVVHCPAELVDEEWDTIGDVDPALARRTATALAREYEGTDVTVGAAHFSDLQFGRLLVGERQRKWVYS
ncbi:MBL fold metallo-hydrolase [Mycobacterium sp. CVI_P3]|uniref:MBL fold metallo-hydrolase n=1 Tax=Mycobacterium pinniadriaticum TaxID=2994102 RepID=A0ABT3SMI4_9MYCO|nr:MBL fold metallo-hydrolase [Mycobacterium pinniadriaticum]MCX2934323.1 MBL fold metallo-hydrolase [Mycobacterium pinniadriaticum]MCX2940746.1 MBL fold metallo-hydrolase [Mycobacterium pinniadriaticum]